jgi:hypothetical protein
LQTSVTKAALQTNHVEKNSRGVGSFSDGVGEGWGVFRCEGEGGVRGGEGRWQVSVIGPLLKH